MIMSSLQGQSDKLRELGNLRMAIGVASKELVHVYENVDSNIADIDNLFKKQLKLLRLYEKVQLGYDADDPDENPESTVLIKETAVKPTLKGFMIVPGYGKDLGIVRIDRISYITGGTEKDTGGTIIQLQEDGVSVSTPLSIEEVWKLIELHS